MHRNILLTLPLFLISHSFAITTDFQKVIMNGTEFIIAAHYKKNSDHLIAFIPGLACTKESFEDAFTAPELTEFSLLSLDLPGCGDSSKSETYSYTMEEQAAVIAEAIMRFPHKKLSLVGHSMGGAIAVLLAERYKNNLETFVNVEGNLVADHCHLSRKAAQVNYSEFKDTLFKELCSNLLKSQDNTLLLWLSWIQKSTPDCFYKSSSSLVKLSENPDLLRKYIDITAKKIYLLGEKSYNKNVTIHGIAIQHIPQATHFIMNNCPLEFYNIVKQMCTKEPNKIQF